MQIILWPCRGNTYRFHSHFLNYSFTIWTVCSSKFLTSLNSKQNCSLTTIKKCFSDSIRANQKLNTNIMKMWTQMKGAESRAEQFLMNILNSFE